MNVSQETAAFIKSYGLQTPSDELKELHKAWVQSGSAVSGITAYDLEAPAKQLYPVITPLRNSIPRVSGKGGIQANWRAVTGVNVGKNSIGVSPGNRNAVMVTTTQDYTAAYKGIGLEDTVQFEADYAAEQFQDIKALAVEGLLRATMIGEEFIILGGDTSLALGNTPTPTLTSANTGGSLTGNIGYGVGCVALTLEGSYIASVAGGIVQSTSRTNADSSTDIVNGGCARPSTQANIVSANSANVSVISASVTPVVGAMAYAWFWGANSGNLSLGAITYVNSVLISAAPTGNQNFQALLASDNSKNGLIYDGLLTIASNPALGSYQATLGTGTPGTGTPLTSDNAGGINEIETALKYFWDTYRLSPDTMWVNSQEMNNIGKKILAAGNASAVGAMRITFDMAQGMVAGGIIVKSYLNKFSMNGMTTLDVKIHPNMPPGTILFTTGKLPYPLSNVTNVMQIRARRDYYQIEWPLRTRKWEYGVYADEVLQHYFPPSMGVITNIANG